MSAADAMPDLPMTIPRLIDPPRLEAPLAQPVLALGNFDGMHRGHRAVIAEAAALAARLVRPMGLLTFEPHPRDFFGRGEPLFRLTSPLVKAELARSLGADLLVQLTFDAALAAMPAQNFVAEILVGRLGIAGAVTGHDFHFGRGREGGPAFLDEAARRHGFALRVVPALASEGEPISSSAIRRALAAGEVRKANALLGYEWRVAAEVRHGDKRGRDLGYPTANMALEPACRLAHGIYAVRAIIDGRPHPAVASFGRRPTFDNGRPLLEVHVFDFRGDLYGSVIEVAFVDWLRGEEKFDDVAALVRQMDADSARARAILAA